MCEILAGAVKKSGFSPNLVVGILNAGFYPSSKLSEIMQLPVEFIYVSRSKPNLLGLNLMDSAIITTILRPAYYHLSLYRLYGTKLNAPFNSHLIEGKNVILVDDDCCSGGTMKKTKEIVFQSNPSAIRTASLRVYPNMKHPDFFAVEETHGANPLLFGQKLFPWDPCSPFYKQFVNLKKDMQRPA